VNNKKQFSGLWGIILGGSSGFGFAALEKLAHHGMNIALLYRETGAAERVLKERVEKIAGESGVSILPFNINALDKDGRILFIQQFNAAVGNKNCIRLLLHSIARGNLKPLAFQEDSTLVLTKEEMADVLSIEDIQLTTYAMSNSLLDWARLLLQEDLFYKDARIIGLTSEGAHKYWESYAAVSVAKASLESLSTYMAVELCKFGLKTNLIQAGITATPSLKRIPGSEKLLEIATKRNPMGRMTKPEDVANAIYLLCTDEAFWINGSVIHVDGGEHCR
jgi:enoyl-[acyl-carrier protein] reductase III